MVCQVEPESRDFRKWYVDQYFGFAGQLGLDGMMHKVIRRAYRDMCRTLDFKKDSSPPECYNEARKRLVSDIKNLKDTPDDAPGYDAWHKRSCDNFKEPYQGVLTYGQAQKWVNMTLKYIYTLQWDYPLLAEPLKSKMKYFHMPIDSYITKASIVRWPEDLEKIYKGLGFAWSNYTDYEKYLELQNKYREICNRQELGCLLDMEFWLWIEADHPVKKVDYNRLA